MNTLKIAEKVFERFETTGKVQAYPGLLALNALAMVGVEAKDDEIIKKCKSYLDLYPNGFNHPKYNFESYRVGGIAKSWMASRGLYDEHLEYLREYAEKTLVAPADRDGILCMPNNDKEQIWIDVVMCTTPFMLQIGNILGEQKYVDFAVDQCFKMYEFFLDKTTGLLHQARGFMADPTKVTPDHWGRGNAWGYIGLAALVEDLPADSIYREKAERYFKDLSKAILAYQNERGAWRQEMVSEFAWDESSCTGMFAYGFGVGMRLGLLDRETYEEPFKKALNVCIDRFINKDFSVNMCCHGCLCPGQGETKGSVSAYLTAVQPVYNDPHAFGPMMMAMIEAYRNGITELGAEKFGA